ncbi:MAG: hypothetical protein Q4Q04_05105 [Methanocorpusculum sp.]|nr:hypothetical protein [Methanocorpusculum sp.]
MSKREHNDKPSAKTAGAMVIVPSGEIGKYPVAKQNKPFELTEDCLATTDEDVTTDPLSREELQEIAKHYETIIQHDTRENILAIDECGNVIKHAVGTREAVTMEREFWDDAAIITHNHPDGVTFSATDVSHLFDTDCGEIRVCSGGAWYSIRKTPAVNLTAVGVEIELSAFLIRADSDAAEAASEKNGITIEINEETRVCRAVRPDGMTKEDFLERAEQARKDYRILRVIALHKALMSYAKARNLIYEVGEL